jgi:hypothetical protein
MNHGRTAARRAAMALVFGCTGLGGASAQTIYAPGQGSPNSKALPVQVTASVGTRCYFAAGGAPNGTFNQDNFDVTGFTHDFPFTLECTGPSRIAVVSSNGGLLTGGSAPASYATKAPYDVTLNVIANGGAPTASATCAVATLVNGSTCGFVGPASETQGLRLAAASVAQSGSYLRVAAPPYAGPGTLVQGSYQDTLIVTVNVSP